PRFPVRRSLRLCRKVLVRLHDDRASDLSADTRDLAHQIAHAGFFGILPNDAEDRFVLEGEAALGQPMGAELARNNMLLCDLELLMLEISGQLDDLHSVCKRQRNVIAHVRRRYEK